MTREEAICELCVIWERLSHPEDCEKGCYSFRDGDYTKALDMAIEALSADAVQGWIPCSERLPEDEESVLADDGTDIFVAWYGEGAWQSTDHAYDPYSPIIAWMPLPEPYEGVTE